MNRIGRAAGTIWLAIRFLLGTVAVTAIAFAAVVGLASAELQQQNVQGTLTITLFTAVGVILVAASIATAFHLWLHNQIPAESRPADPRLASAFERYVAKFAWIIGPITASYGLIRVLEAIN